MIISVEFDIHDSVTIEAVNLFKPDIIIAPYLRRKIPKEITAKVFMLDYSSGTSRR